MLVPDESKAADLERKSRRGISTTLATIGLIAMIAAASYSAYFAYQTRGQGGAPFSGFSATISQSNSSLTVQKGEVLVIIPNGANANPKLTFQPQNIYVVLGVNSTILFQNQDTREHIIQSIQWPAGGQPFDLWLIQGKSGTVQLNTTGIYVYNFELNPSDYNATITVV